MFEVDTFECREVGVQFHTANGTLRELQLVHGCEIDRHKRWLVGNEANDIKRMPKDERIFLFYTCDQQLLSRTCSSSVVT